MAPTPNPSARSCRRPTTPCCLCARSTIWRSIGRRGANRCCISTPIRSTSAIAPEWRPKAHAWPLPRAAVATQASRNGPPPVSRGRRRRAPPPPRAGPNEHAALVDQLHAQVVPHHHREEDRVEAVQQAPVRAKQASGVLPSQVPLQHRLEEVAHRRGGGDRGAEDEGVSAAQPVLVEAGEPEAEGADHESADQSL